MAKQTAEYKNHYAAEHYDRINLSIPKGLKDLWLERADAEGKSLNRLIIDTMESKKSLPG